LTSSQSSLIAPYLYLDDNRVSDNLAYAVSMNSPTSRTFVGQSVQSSGSDTLSGCDALLAQLQENSEVFSNGKTDLVMLQFQQYDSTTDACLQRLNSYVNTRTNNYIALLSADESSTNVITSFREKSQSEGMYTVHTRRLLKSTDSGNTTYTGPQYITPSILFGILLSFLLIFILWTGLSCILYIEVPVRFPEAHPKDSLSKEY